MVIIRIISCFLQTAIILIIASAKLNSVLTLVMTHVAGGC